MQMNMQNCLHGSHVLYEHGSFTQLSVILCTLENRAMRHKHVLRVKQLVLRTQCPPLYTSRRFYFELALF